MPDPVSELGLGVDVGVAEAEVAEASLSQLHTHAVLQAPLLVVLERGVDRIAPAPTSAAEELLSSFRRAEDVELGTLTHEHADLTHGSLVGEQVAVEAVRLRLHEDHLVWADTQHAVILEEQLQLLVTLVRMNDHGSTVEHERTVPVRADPRNFLEIGPVLSDALNGDFHRFPPECQLHTIDCPDHPDEPRQELCVLAEKNLLF